MREPSAVIIFVKHGSFLLAGPTQSLFTQWSHFYVVSSLSASILKITCASVMFTLPLSGTLYLKVLLKVNQPPPLTWSSHLNTFFETLPYLF